MPRLRLLPVLVPLLCTLSLRQANAQKPVASNETLPRDLVLRLLNYSGGLIYSGGEVQQLLVGRLPNQLPVKLPLPDKAQVIASVVREPANFEILLEVAQPPEQVQTFYREQLKAAGWQKPAAFGDLKGFVSFDFAPEPKFCKSSRGPELNISVNPTQKATISEVRLNLNASSASGSLCEKPYIVDVPLPTLSAPPNTLTNPKGAGGSNEHMDSSAILETKLDSQTLVGHFSAQFKGAGWRQQDSGQSGPMGWSFFTLKNKKGQSWQGMLSITQFAGKPNQYFASASVFRL